MRRWMGHGGFGFFATFLFRICGRLALTDLKYSKSSLKLSVHLYADENCV